MSFCSPANLVRQFPILYFPWLLARPLPKTSCVRPAHDYAMNFTMSTADAVTVSWRAVTTHAMSSETPSFSQLMRGVWPCLSRPLAAHVSSTRLPCVVVTSTGLTMNRGADPAAAAGQPDTTHIYCWPSATIAELMWLLSHVPGGPK